jgi:hypothetical protein
MTAAAPGKTANDGVSRIEARESRASAGMQR